jgi:hypothetical protein
MVISSQGQPLDYHFVLSSEESGQLHGQVVAGPDASLYFKVVTPNGLYSTSCSRPGSCGLRCGSGKERLEELEVEAEVTDR